jgi:hypothetical protein
MNLYPCRNACTIIITCLLLAGIPAAMAADGTNATSSAGGTIIVMTFPQGASVYLNDEYRGISPIKLENIPPGNYLVNVSKAGASNDSAPVVLFEGSTREIGFTLESASPAPAVPTGSGTVAVDSIPGGASVMLDGKNVGTTRMDGYALIVDNVPSGSHTVTVELSGYPPSSSTVTVTKNQVVKVSADFQSQSPATATLPGTPPATTDRRQPAPLSPLTAVAAAGIIGLAAAFRRS